ncbi:MAG: hypothetical protein MUC61_01290 [Amoebophilaceae bacterium]|jgi:hypothetical protein|nr:hypothetical protein [Amoebophilaceae bacterium]
MNKVSRLEQLANFLLYVALQLTVVRVIVFAHTACFIYVAFLLLLPRGQKGLISHLFIGFFVGLLVDLFYHSIGVHAFASVLMVYSRTLLLKLMLPTGSYESAIQPTLRNLGWQRFSLFSLLLISVHHIALFFLEANNILLFFVVMRRAILSTLSTYVAVLLMQSMVLLINKK